MTTLTEGTYKGDIVKWEQEARYSRDVVTVGTGSNLVIGQVVGQVTASGKYVKLAPAASDGSQTAAGILLMDAAAASADVANVVMLARDAVIDYTDLVWPSGISNPQKTTALAQLKAIGIISRKGV